MYQISLPWTQVSGQRLPSLAELFADDRNRSIDYAHTALKWHDAVTSIMARHVELSTREEQQLRHHLKAQGFTGKRDNCGECPLANAYFHYWKLALAARDLATLTISVDVAMSDLTIATHGVLSPGETCFLQLRLPLSIEQQAFVRRFDNGSYPELDEDPIDPGDRLGLDDEANL
jgi:hypothetical protein